GPARSARLPITRSISISIACARPHSGSSRRRSISTPGLRAKDLDKLSPITCRSASSTGRIRSLDQTASCCERSRVLLGQLFKLAKGLGGSFQKPFLALRLQEVQRRRHALLFKFACKLVASRAIVQ